MKYLIFLLLLVPFNALASDASAFNAQIIINLVNEQRVHQGLNVLKVDKVLCDVAQEKGLDMVFNGYFAHVSPTGQTVNELVNDKDKRMVVGNNLALGFNDTISLVTSWMNSESHRQNILYPHYNRTCVSVVSFHHDSIVDNYVVQVFSN